MSEKSKLIKNREMVQRVQKRLADEGRAHSLVEVKHFIDAFIGEAAIAVTRDNAEVALGDLGRLILKHVNERTGRNPGTGESIHIPEHKRLAFKVSSRYNHI